MDTFGSCSNLESVTISNSVTKIEDFAFDGCDSLSNIYYTGTQWNNIDIWKGNAPLMNAAKHYNYVIT